MASICKFSGYFVDPNDRGHNYISLNSDSFVRHLHMVGTQFNLEDNNPLYNPNCDLAYCEQYFKKEPNATETNSDRVVKPGQKWRHFKEGKIVEVIAVAQDTENPGFWYVVYNCPVKLDSPDFSTWVRPLDMFLSEVDHEKYPNATQKYRLELVSDPNEV